MDLRALGIRREDDSKRDEYTYIVGAPGHIPIALFLLIASPYKNAVARYFNMFTHTKHANDLQKEFLKQKITVNEDFRDIFQGDEPHISFTKQIQPVDKNAVSNLPLHLYSEQFAKIIAMKTHGYESNAEGVVLTCPMSYINFWNREEFTVIDKNLNQAGLYILSEVTRIFELRGIEFNKHFMTIPDSKFKGFEFTVSYGF